MKKAIFLLPILCFGLGLILLESCQKEPLVCFQVNTPEDSIRVGKVVEFSGACSINVNDYYWTFGNMKTNIGDIVTSTVYDSVGTYSVTLLSNRGSQSYKVTKSIEVKP